MKRLLPCAAAILIAAAAAPAFAEGGGPGRAPETTQRVLNGHLNIGASTNDADVELYRTKGQTSVQVTDQIDSVNGKVMATATTIASQVNNAPVRARAVVGVNAGNRAADVTAAAVGNTLSIISGVSQ